MDIHSVNLASLDLNLLVTSGRIERLPSQSLAAPMTQKVAKLRLHSVVGKAL
jgi:hypothetical protein